MLAERCDQQQACKAFPVRSIVWFAFLITILPKRAGNNAIIVVEHELERRAILEQLVRQGRIRIDRSALSSRK
jgi:hypothetical protein